MKSYIELLRTLLFGRSNQKFHENDFLGFEAFTRQTLLAISSTVIQKQKVGKKEKMV